MTDRGRGTVGVLESAGLLAISAKCLPEKGRPASCSEQDKLEEKERSAVHFGRGMKGCRRNKWKKNQPGAPIKSEVRGVRDPCVSREEGRSCFLREGASTNGK